MDARLAIVLPVLFVCGCAAQMPRAESAVAVVPYTLRDAGRIVVDVQINRQGPFRFAIDTAATGSFIVERVRQQLELDVVGGETATVHGAVASGEFSLVEVEQLSVGRENWGRRRLIALPGDTPATETLDGVLGIDFLLDYSIGFSVRQRELSLYRPEQLADEAYRGWATIELEPVFVGAAEQPLQFFAVTISGRQVDALFDLGSGFNVLNSAAAAELDLASRIARQNELSGAIGTESILVRFGAESIRTGRVGWRNERFLIADIDIFELLELGDTPAAILGSGLFTQRDFVIDLSRRRVLVRIAMQEQETIAD
ncbi:MAG: retroviral-like aspartic protease family protein [Gammaproteobacteria bacterium]|nr:retroviral-like aspartic protease family protein [Gammaproteobacteria bacterium]